MDVRRANTGDMKIILDFMEEYHKESNLKDIPFDRPSAVKIVEYFIGTTSCNPLIALDNDKMVGLLFGSLEPFFFNRKKSYATDLMFISNGAGVQLWKRFKEWALHAGAERIMMGVSSENERADQLLEALGMKQTGGMYVLRS
jgi:hypothetical protein